MKIATNENHKYDKYFIRKLITAKGHSNRKIADILGVDAETINRDQCAANTAPIFDNTDVGAALGDGDAANAAPDKATRPRQLTDG
jgi:hypothetical protein